MSDPQPRFGKVKFLLVLLPIWLFASGGAALWYYFHAEEKKANQEQARFAQAVSIPMLDDDLKKIVEVIGERNTASATASANLSRMASMIEGILGPGNTGFKVTRTRGPAEWPLLHCTIKGTDLTAPAVWVITSYDSRVNSRGAEANATGLAATFTAAQALAADKPATSIHFLFLPHANELDAPIAETATKCMELINSGTPPKAILCIEAMGAGEPLWLSSRDTSAIPLQLISNLGAVYGAEVICLGEDTDLASVLFEMNLPAVRVATRAILPLTEKDDRLPFSPTVAASSGRLIELIRRCAAK